ncbi:DNA-binding transcriptional regulator, LysR family [Enhydrobacter aerosaccus]|uniref:DNA-binding transcriptional regulator, LysR family n=2 Tax=Enhydrobacter aerosaccus TaxID=225324 RepID=A0A1T4PCR7_9HYPH|nr:DNA-binding transcriptional regulator, LysR family [Enhydrobacter aerosaccus]
MKNRFSWLKSMFWDDLHCFVAVANAGTLSGGAKRLGMSTATIGRRINSLESVLGIRLVDKSPTGVQLTNNGTKILTLANAGARQIDEVQRIAASLRMADWPEPIRISATEPIVSGILAPQIAQLFRMDPTVRVDLRSATENARLISREADLAIRLSQPKGDSLVARRLATLTMSLYAARGYLRGRNPRAIDLSEERLVAFNESYGEIPEIKWISDMGLESRVVFTTSSTGALIEAVRAGVGIGLLPDMFTREFEDIERVTLRLLLPTRTPWLLVHRDLRAVKQLRTVRRWIVQAFEGAQGEDRKPRHATTRP